MSRRVLSQTFVLLGLVSQLVVAFQTTTPNDTTMHSLPDSLRVRFLPRIGNINQHSDSTDVLHSSQFVQTDSRELSDLIWKIPGFLMRDLGEFGLPGQLNAMGMDGQTITVLLD